MDTKVNEFSFECVSCHREKEFSFHYIECSMCHAGYCIFCARRSFRMTITCDKKGIFKEEFHCCSLCVLMFESHYGTLVE